MRSIVFFVLVWTLVDCNPLGYGRPREYQSRRYHPQHAMMFSGFYGAPNSYQGAISAFANKDMVATNSFTGEQYPIQYPEVTETSVNFAAKEELELTQTSTSKPKRNKNKKATTTTQRTEYDDDDEEEVEDDYKDTPAVRNPQRGYNNFFPINFGAGNGRNANGGYPGGAVAIANSYSTGKGGVASSHATAYGNPYSRSNGNGKKQH